MRLVLKMMWQKNNISDSVRQAVRFCLVGGLATAVHYGMYMLLNLWLAAILAYAMGYVVSFCMNYILTNVFTFRTHPSVRNGMGFLLSHVINFILHLALLECFLWCGVSERWAPLPVYAIVVPVNFLLLKYFFRRHER